MDDTIRKLSFLDRFFIPVDFFALFVGVVWGYISPGVVDFWNQFQSGTTNIPIAVGLILITHARLVGVPKYRF